MLSVISILQQLKKNKNQNKPPTDILDETKISHLDQSVSFNIIFYAETIFNSKAKYIFRLCSTFKKELVSIEYSWAAFIPLHNQLPVHLLNTQLQHKLNYKPLLHSLSYSSIFSKLSLLLYEYVKTPVSNKNYLYGGLKLACRSWNRGDKGKTLQRKHTSLCLPIIHLTPGIQKVAAICKLELVKATREVH